MVQLFGFILRFEMKLSHGLSAMKFFPNTIKLSDFYSPETAEVVINVLLSSPNVELTEPYFYYNFVEADPDDNKFANLSISTGARYLVSNDKHFNIFKQIEFPILEVVKLDEFKNILGV